MPDPYITAAELSLFIGGGTALASTRDHDLEMAVQAASQAIDLACGRNFREPAEDAEPTARLFTPMLSMTLLVDDFATRDGLEVEVDWNGRGTFSTLTTAVDFTLEPANANEKRKPFERIRLRERGGRLGRWPIGIADSVRVTAVWGWPETPATVPQYVKSLGARLMKRKDAPLGVASFGQDGTAMRMMRDDPDSKLLTGELALDLIVAP